MITGGKMKKGKQKHSKREKYKHEYTKELLRLMPKIETIYN